ncbi:MAG: hypothetical protein ACYDDO_02715 [Acidiferrobacterales bacterium]
MKAESLRTILQKPVFLRIPGTITAELQSPECCNREYSSGADRYIHGCAGVGFCIKRNVIFRFFAALDLKRMSMIFGRAHLLRKFHSARVPAFHLAFP